MRGKFKKSKILMLLLVLVAAGVYYYVTLPAINIHSSGFWIFMIAVLALALFLYGGKNIRTAEELKSNKILKLGIGVIALVVVVFAVGTLLSSPIVNAKKYRELIEPETGNFTEDIEQIRYDQIPILDKESAMLLGNRKMGSMVDMVSQFEVSDLYSQINYNGRPVRVTPLVYASPIKWLTNMRDRKSVV